MGAFQSREHTTNDVNTAEVSPSILSPDEVEREFGKIYERSNHLLNSMTHNPNEHLLERVTQNLEQNSEQITKFLNAMAPIDPMKAAELDQNKEIENELGKDDKNDADEMIRMDVTEVEENDVDVEDVDAQEDGDEDEDDDEDENKNENEDKADNENEDHDDHKIEHDEVVPKENIDMEEHEELQSLTGVSENPIDEIDDSLGQINLGGSLIETEMP